VGVYEYARREGGVSAPLICRMRDTLRHRGPDGAGIYVTEDRRVGLGHRRLAIVDPPGGAQPMFGQRGECLVFNGEIYNYPALRRTLEMDGAEFATNCDTEVILHLYARLGAECVHELTGMFAFALWDPRRQEMLLARDPIGEKPLYWTEAAGRLIFGSEIKSLLEHPSVTPRVNDQALGEYLANLVVSSPNTLFRGISKLPPGSHAVCDPSGMTRIYRYSAVADGRYWNDVSLAESTREVSRLLRTSVEARLMSDVPVGVLLSGGLDSTTLLALLDEKAPGMPTFSVGFPTAPEFDEREEARKVARHFRTEHHEVDVSEVDALRFLPSLVHHQDEPLGDPVCLPLHFVCELAKRQGVKVLLAGEGADELFWGYPDYLRILARWPWIRMVLSLPQPARRALPALVSASSRPRRRETLDAIAAGRPLPMHFPLGLAKPQRERVLREEGTDPWSPSTVSTNGESAIDRLAFDTQEYEFDLRLPELLLMRIDRFSMASSVEARVPFLDPELVRYVYHLPMEHKLDRQVTKVVLRQATRGLVPDWVLQRPKQGFDAPVIAWLQQRFGRILDVLLDGPIARYIDSDAVRRMNAAGQLNAWPILNLALWHRYWIEREPLEPLVERVAAGTDSLRSP
jgi:asparagine synthase (glutamine-hydrolysing)